jgi:hypothetical protein
MDISQRRIEDEELRVLRDIDHTEHEILDRLSPKLTFIKISFLRGEFMAEGPVTLQVGQSTIASIDYFDQNGNLMPPTFVPPNVTYSIDQPTIASSTPNADNQTDAVAYVAAGVANLTATVAGPNGPLTDTETVTCVAGVTAPPVLSSIKINFAAPTPASLSAAKPAPNAPPLIKGQVSSTGTQVK